MTVGEYLLYAFCAMVIITVVVHIVFTSKLDDKVDAIPDALRRIKILEDALKYHMTTTHGVTK